MNSSAVPTMVTVRLPLMVSACTPCVELVVFVFRSDVLKAGGNVTSVAVRCKPRVAFVPTGNELVPAGSAVVPIGKNIESNSLVVRGKVEAWGGVFLPFDIVPDDPDLIVQAVKKACACANIVVLNAGSSKGSDDWSVEQLEEIGAIICHQVNHGPAHHSSAAVVDGTPVWASPTRRSAPRSHWGSTCCLL